MNVREVREKYDAFAPSYDWTEGVIEVLGVRRLRRRLVSPARGRVLEVGVGTGNMILAYPPGCRITGVDLSRQMLERARAKMRRREGGGHCAQMDVHVLAFPDDTFDTVVDAFCLCTYHDPIGAIREMIRVCRPDGRLLLLEHGRSSWPVLARLQDRTAAAHARTLGCVWNREPQGCLAAAGLQLVRARRTFLGVFHAIEAVPGTG